MDQEQKQMLIGGVVGTVVTLAASYAFMGGKSEPKEEAKKTETPKADDSKKIADLNAKIAALEKTLVSRPAEKELNIPTFFPLANVKADIEVEKRHSKIICTLGPACNKKEQLVSMIDAGLNVARLNFSHGDHESHGKQVETLKEALKERPDKRVALMLDTKGPEIRTGNLKEGKNITLKIGQALEITTDYTIEGDNTKISCSYPALAQSVKVGQTIFIADGSLTCKVTELKTDSIMVKVMNDATIGQKKNMNLPGVVVKLPILSVKDTEDIKVFGAKHKIDMVAASFVQSADNVNHIRDVLKSSGQPNVAIISKIENQAGLDNLDAIIAACDGIMVARGDLGMEIAPEKVFIAQKWMIKKCNAAGKPVQTATQMLESMINNPRPTRAEASDVANAVLDGTDAVMLSGESANGQYPSESVTMLARTSCEAERCIDFKHINTKLFANVPKGQEVHAAAVKAQIESGANFMVVNAENPANARFISKYRPSVNVIAFASDDQVCNNLNTMRNIFPVKVASNKKEDAEKNMKAAIETAKRVNVIKAEGKYIQVNFEVTGHDVKTL